MKKLPFAVVSALVFVLIALSFSAHLHPYFSIDLKTTLFLQKFKYTPLHDLMTWVSWFGYGATKYIALAIIVVLISIKKYRKEAWILVFSAVGVNLFNNILKTLVSRHRPDPLLVTQVDHFAYPDSFPSGHVMFYVCFFGFLFYLVNKFVADKNVKLLLLTFFGLMITLVGLSRIYLGAHWLSDVIGAYLAGFLWLYLSIFIYKKIKYEK